MSADCEGGGHPSFSANTGLGKGLSAEFDTNGPNQNVVLYSDGKWPYESGAVAKTMLGFSTDTGSILDADIVLNSSEFPLAIDPVGSGEIDLIAVLTHELGHVLGLAHSDAPHATMQRETRGFATVELRTLEADDMDGICAIYPPQKDDPSTHAGDSGDSSDPSTDSGCALVARRPPSSPWSLCALLAVASYALRKRSRRGQSLTPWLVQADRSVPL